jgi:thiamine-phosphate pyrophosphorylase
MSSEHPKLPRGLYAVCDDCVRAELPLVRKCELLLQGGAQVIQLRMKRTASGEALAAARRVSALCRATGAICLVNDRVDLVLMSGAHGVHLGDEDLPPRLARAILGAERIIGVTARNLKMVQAAREAGADYVGVGPVFPTATKRVDAPLVGLEGLTSIADESPVPVVGISGINLANIGLIAKAGAHGAAVVSDLLSAPDIALRARALSTAFAEGRGE